MLVYLKVSFERGNDITAKSVKSIKKTGTSNKLILKDAESEVSLGQHLFSYKPR